MEYPGLMHEMIPQKDFERLEQGLPPRPKKEIVIPEPVPPIVENQIYFKDFQNKEIQKVNGHIRTVKNKDGVRFMGFDLFVTFKDGSEIGGWISEADFLKLRLLARASENDTGISRILG